MSKPHDNGSDDTYPDDNYKPVGARAKALSRKSGSLSKVFGGTHNAKKNARQLKKGRAYAIKHF